MTDQIATRVTRSLTADWEKRNLPKIARALPEWVQPDHLTLLGVAAAMGIGAGYVLSNYSPHWLWASILGLFFHWAGDSLDGTLARVRKQEREKYGYYVDRTADAVSTVIVCISFGFSPYANVSVGLLLCIGYLLMMLHAEICAYTSGTFPMSFAGFGPTEARITLGLFTASLIFWRPEQVVVGGHRVTMLDIAGAGVSVLLFGCFLVRSVIQARWLDRTFTPARSP